MSFIKITDPRKREAMIKDFTETRKRIKDNFLTEKVGEIGMQRELSKFFKPVMETQKTTAKETIEAQKATSKEITEGLRPIKEGIDKLPKAIAPPPPPYEFPFADEYEVPGEKEVDEKKKKKKKKPGYIKKTGEVYKLGNLFIDFDEVNENVLTEDGEIFSDSPKIYDILTNKNSNVTWDDLNKEERQRLGVLIIYSKAIQKYPDNKPKQIGNRKIWNNLYSHIWFNRFSYMNDKEIYDNEIRDAYNLYKKPHKKTTSETKEKIKKALKIEDVDFDKRRYRTPKERPTEETGSGLTILPSDPNALIERLDLLLASQNAGHSNVRNELVSICDELKRQGAISVNEYKKLNSIIKK